MESPVIQLIKHLVYDKHRFTYHKNKWIAHNREVYQKTADAIKHINLNADHKTACLKDMSFTVFDLETTGLHSGLGDEIISIGAAKINLNHMRFSEHFYEVVSPVKLPSSHIRDLTGLSLDAIKEGKPFPLSLLNFLKFSEGTVLVAHPASFDVTFLSEQINRWSLPDFDPVFIDSFQVARFLYPDQRNTLDELVFQFQIDQKDRHHALNDAAMTADVFVRLIEELCKREIKSISMFESVVNGY